MQLIIDNKELLARITAEKAEWYPSAGDDMANVWSAFKHDQDVAPRPTLFIHTDWGYSVPSWNGFPDEIRADGIVLTRVREYNRLPAESRGFCSLGKNDVVYSGRCIEYGGTIEMGAGEVRRVSLIRIAIENEQFAAEFLLPHHIRLEALVHKNCGWGCGGGATIPGTWMRSILGRLHVKYFISDRHGLNGTRDSMQVFDENNHVTFEKFLIEQCRPGEFQAAQEFPILQEPPGSACRFIKCWDECWDFCSPHGYVTCFAIRISPCKKEEFETIVVKGREVPVMNNFFDLIRYAYGRKICVRPCSACCNYEFKCLCQVFGHDKLQHLINRVTDEDICNAEHHYILHRWVETIDILATASDFTPFPQDSILGRRYAEICAVRGKEAIRRKEELALKEKMRRDEHDRIVAEHIRAHKMRQASYRVAWDERCRRMAGLELEGKLKILIEDNTHLPSYYPIDLCQISSDDLESVSLETLQKIVGRFAVLRKQDWQKFREFVKGVVEKREGK